MSILLPSGNTARYLSVLGGFLTSLGSGTHYVYSAYGPQLASHLGFSATESEVIATLGSVGVYFSGPPAGILIDHKPPYMPIFLGGSLILLGYMMMRLAYETELRSLAFVSIWMMVASTGNTFAYHACVKTAAVNFPKNRGLAIAFPVAGYGLSALFFSQIGNAAFPGDTGKFLLMLPLLSSGLIFLGLPLVRHIGPKPVEDKETAVETEALLSDAASDETAKLTEKSKEANYSTMDEDSTLYASSSNEVVVEETPATTADGLDIHGWALFRQWRFWVHFAIHGLLSGVGLAYVLSAGYVLRALYTYDNPNITPQELLSKQAVQVSLISVSSFISRIIAGTIGDRLRRAGHQRMWCILGSALIFMFGQIGALTINTPRMMWYISVMNGLGYGTLFGTYASVFSEIFGLKHFTENYGYLTVATVFGSDVFAYSFGAIYDHNSFYMDPTDGEMMNMRVQVCTKGLYCYRTAYTMTLPAAFIAVILAATVIYIEHRKIVSDREAAQEALRKETEEIAASN
ncbi:major facilitator superfamily domain-containing protein [Dipodascopsis tothii]|uniref:major facilitator superfamily domain-containing protein n=1 Tax=Dipodascopsis tothii TaxID=44089 RepID=UPI0034CDE5D5